MTRGHGYWLGLPCGTLSFLIHHRLSGAPKLGLKATSENPELCVTLPRRNAHLPCVNSAFVSVASLDFGVFGGCLNNLQQTKQAGVTEGVSTKDAGVL